MRMRRRRRRGRGGECGLLEEVGMLLECVVGVNLKHPESIVLSKYV